MNKIIEFIKDEEGAELVEWSVFVAVLVISIVAAIQALQGQIVATWQAIGTVLSDAAGGGAGGA